MIATDLTPSKRFWRLLAPDAQDIRHVYIYSIFTGLVGLSLPLGIQAIVNLIQGGQVNTAWIVLLIFVVGGVIFSGVLQIFQLKIVENLQQKIFSRAAFEFAHRIPRITMERLYRHYAPELMNRFFDVMSLQKGLPKILIDFSTAIVHVVFGLILLSFYHSFFVFFSILLVLFVFIIFWLTARKGLETSLTESKYKYRVAHWLEELARTTLTFKLAGRTNLPLMRINRHVNDYLDARNSHFTILVQQYWLMVAFKGIVALGLLAIGGKLVMDQRINIGQFVGAEIVVLLIMSAVEKLITTMETIYDVLTGLEKIGQVTDMELENHSGLDLEEECQAQGLDLNLKNVSFAYPESNHKILNNISINIDKGEKWLITGPSGSGKSTLLQIIAGIYKIQTGEISYNGLPQGNLNLQSVRSVIGECLESEQLFEGTLLENIMTGRPGATFENVKWVVSNIGLQSFLNSLPDGYDTRIDPQGKKLPRSIVQKILIARSVVDIPKLILLENILEAISPEEVERIVDFLTDKQRPWTLIAVSANKYLASRVDRIAILNQGKVTSEGGYAEFEDLLTNNINPDAEYI